MNLNQALLGLDPGNDEHWTSDGAPRLDVVSQMIGREVKRAEITTAAPEFSRETARGAREGGVIQEDRLEPGVAPTASDVDRQALEDLDREISAADAEIKALVAKKQALVDERDLLVKTHNFEFNSGADQQARMDYIAAQNAARAARFARNSEILKGLKGQDLRTAAPIDAAMARRNTRGTQRPRRPLMGSESN